MKKNAYLPRAIEASLLDAAKQFPCITIYGPRQVGKSTLVETLFHTFHYVTLDDVDDLYLALNNPKGFLSIHSWPLIIDEVQRAPNLLLEIKRIVDAEKKLWLLEGKTKQLMFVLTGSNQFELQNAICESLAGRTAVFHLFSLTTLEADNISGSLFKPDIGELLLKEKDFQGKVYNKKQIFEIIFRGGMPEPVALGTNRDAFFRAYLTTYIEKDVRRLISATSEMQFRRFISYLALRTGQQVNYEVFSRELGIDSATCKRWMSILQTSGIITLIEPYMANISARIIKSSKLYFMDTGLCAYLCKWPTAEMLENGVMAGAFFETYVVSEVIKNFHNYGQEPAGTIFYYRDIDQKEIDLLYVEGDKIYPMEIKKGIVPSKPTKNFKVLAKYGMKIMPGLVIDNCDRIRPINDLAYSFPVSKLGM